MSWKALNLPSKISLLNNKYSKGFTLIELSIVMMILALLFSMLIGVKVGVDRLLLKSRSPMQKRTEAFQIFHHIISSINNTFYIKNDKNLIFIGKGNDNGSYRQDRLDFITVDPYTNSLNKESEVKEVSYYLKAGSSSELFMLIKREDAFVDKFPRSGGEHIVLLRNVKSFSLAYSASRTSDRFKKDWDSKIKKKIPRRVEIKIVTEISPGNEFVLQGMATPGAAKK